MGACSLKTKYALRDFPQGCSTRAKKNGRPRNQIPHWRFANAVNLGSWADMNRSIFKSKRGAPASSSGAPVDQQPVRSRYCINFLSGSITACAQIS
jgi:hypothetical protein